MTNPSAASNKHGFKCKDARMQGYPQNHNDWLHKGKDDLTTLPNIAKMEDDLPRWHYRSTKMYSQMSNSKQFKINKI